MITLLLIFLTSCASQGFGRRPIPSDYEVTDLKQFGAKDHMYAGFMPLSFVDNAEGNFFFWLATQRNLLNTSSRKLVIWLNGGPGCSSMTGMMWENGPFNIQDGDNNKKYNLKYNPYSWNEVADVLFVEQPLRAGYSTAAEGSRIIKNEHQVAEDFHRFMLSFLEVFKEFQNVPVMAQYILHTQQQSGIAKINLQGVAIGNGVIDYFIQQPAYAEFAYTHGFIPLGAKQKFDKLWINCVEELEASGERITRSSFGRCNLMQKVLEAAGKPNEYDTKTFNHYDDLMLPDGVYHRFFNDPMIQEIIHVRGKNLIGVNFVPETRIGGAHLEYDASSSSPLSATVFVPNKWVVCNNEVNSAMDVDHPTTTVPALQFIAKYIRVLLYSGESDFNCNTLGTLHTLEANNWLGRPWNTANRSLWKFANDVGGEYFNIGDAFSFLIVRNSGHLLPMDMPALALEMLRKFLDNESFADVWLPNEASYLDQDTTEYTQSLRSASTVINNSSPGAMSTVPAFIVAMGCAIMGGLLILMFVRLHRRRGNERLSRTFASHTTSESITAPSAINMKSALRAEISTEHYNSGRLSTFNFGKTIAAILIYFVVDADADADALIYICLGFVARW
eukprot:gene3654-7281_t